METVLSRGEDGQCQLGLVALQASCRGVSVAEGGSRAAVLSPSSVAVTVTSERRV